MKRLVPALAVVALAPSALFAACGSDDGPAATGPGATGPGTATEAKGAPADTGALRGAPAPLAALHRQAGELLDGGADAFEARLDELRGYPVVVNKWASWCPPCRAEFPYFAAQATKRAKRVAFLGVDSNDEDSAAERFLREFPVPYPSYKDPDLKVAQVFKAGGSAFPSTAFYDSKGELVYLKQGGYASEQKLAEDIERYAR